MGRTVPMHEHAMGGYINQLKGLVILVAIAAVVAALVIMKPWQFGFTTEKRLRSNFTSAQKLATAAPSNVERLTELHAAGKALGDYYLQLGMYDEARKVFVVNVRALHELTRARPEAIRYKVNQAIVLENLGVLSNRLGDTIQAEQDFRSSVDIWRALSDSEAAATDSEVVPSDIQNGLADALFNLGSFLDMCRLYDGVEDLYREVIDIREKLSLEVPGSMSNWLALTRAQRSLGILYRKYGWSEPAEKQLNACIDLQIKLVEANPKWAELRDQLGVSYNIIGMFCNEEQRYEQAEQMFLEAIRIFEQLTVNYPKQGTYKEGFASALTGLANIYYLQERINKAGPLYGQAHVTLQQLVELSPTSAVYQEKLAASHYNLGQICEDLERHTLAAKEYQSALAIRRSLSSTAPDNPVFQDAIATTLHANGRLEFNLGQFIPAERNYTEARKKWHRLIEIYPDESGYRESLSALYSDFADLCTQLNDTNRASIFQKQARTIRDKTLEQ